jgi:tRNA 5-methylaminomethyl-2-thiouridine biosynthesis bifunctional protein
LDAQGEVLSQADLAVLACGPATPTLLPAGTAWPLQPLRGQITWGLHTQANDAALPPFPINGNGNLVTHVPFEQGAAWVMGSTFERDVSEMPISHADQIAAHAVNYDKLATLLPHSAAPLAPWFTPGDAHCQATWGRVRVASHDRLPIAGPVSPSTPGLWALTAMGARGLTLSVLCGELMAAQLHGEPLPLDAKLAQHLGTERLARQGHKAEVAPLPEN